MASTTPETFHLFTLLAPELRVKIWQLACQPRTVSLRYVPERDICLSSSPAPTILHVSHESRTEASKTYRLSFGTQSSLAHIYFNPHLDTLYRPRWRQMGYDDTLRDFRSFIKQEEKTWLDELGRIAIDYIDVEVKRPWEGYNRAMLVRSFPKLEEVVMVLRGGEGEEFVEALEEPEEVLRKWVEFRRSFVLEERVLEEVSKVMGTEYVKWKLPTVKVRSKSRKAVVSPDVDETSRLLLEYQPFRTFQGLISSLG